MNKIDKMNDLQQEYFNDKQSTISFFRNLKRRIVQQGLRCCPSLLAIATVARCVNWIH